MEFEKLGFGNRDGFCPHCGEFYEKHKLEDMLSLEEYTELKCRKCTKWIRGYADFSIDADIDYHLVAIKPEPE